MNETSGSAHSPDRGTSLDERYRRFSAVRARSVVDGWSYQRIGTGHPVVWLPGGAGDATIWFDQAMRMARERASVLIHFPAIASVNELVSGVLRVMDDADAVAADVVGTSLGGMIAERVAARAPARVRSLVLGNTGRVERTGADALRRSLRLLRLMPTAVLRAGAIRRIEGLLAGCDDAGLWGELYTRPYRSHDVRARLVAQQRTLVELAESAPDLTGWSGRTSIVSADDDQLITIAARERLCEAHPSARRVRFPSGGHLLVATRADDYAAALREALLG